MTPVSSHQLARRGVGERFAGVGEAAGQRPHALVRLAAAVDQQDAQLSLADGEDDDENGDAHAAIVTGD